MKRFVHGAVTVLALTSVAEANQGPRDANGYIGTDSLAPALKLPATGLISLTLDANAASSSGDIASTATLDASIGNEDATYAFNVNAGGTASFAGTNLSSCLAHTNGLITCFGGTSPLFDNQPLPDTRFSGRYVVAPFWDDLTVVAGQSSIKYEVRTGVSFTVQWNNFSLYSNAAARLTFRVTFYYGTSSGAVAFHYLSMMGTGADGRSATIGIQAPNTQFERSNQYAYNKMGAITVGTATSGLATQAILFDVDGDGDRLPRALEVIATTADNDADSDDGGLDDGAEIAANKDPTSNADDGATTDTDGDGLTDLDEAFYGTNPALVDTDGDKDAATPVNANAARSDADELYGVGGYFTDPKRADTDGDGYNDGREIFAGTDPMNRTDFPRTVASDGTLGRWRNPHAALDATENVHIAMVSEGGVLVYTMLDSQGVVLIPATKYKPSSTLDIRSAHIGITGGKAYIVFEALRNGSSVQGILRVNPALAPRDGTPVPLGTVLEADTLNALSGIARHCDASVDATGIVIACERHPSADGPDGNATPRGIEVASFGLDGSLKYDVTAASFQNSEQGQSDYLGIHKVSAPQVQVDSTGVAHVVYMAKYGPRNGSSALSTYYYASLSTTGAVSGPYYLAPGHAERFATALHGTSLLIADTNGENNSGQGVRTGEFDVANLGLRPHIGDPLGITTEVTMANPMKTIYVNDVFRSAGLVRRADGQALITFHQSRGTHKICVAAASNQGVLQGNVQCGLLNDFGSRQRFQDPLVFANGAFGIVYRQRNSATPNGCCSGRGTGRVLFAKFPAGAVVFASTVNNPPTFTSPSTAQTARAGAALSYTVTATDIESPTALTFSLAAGPTGVTVSASGAVSWTPTAAQVGAAYVTVQVCDNGNPSPVLCAKQTINVNVVDAHAPTIVSIPAPVANVGLAYNYQVVASDPDNDVMTYALASPASGDMALSSTGMLTWTPTEAEIGIVSIVVQATDATGLTGAQSFSVNVDYGNYHPATVGDSGCCSARSRAPTAPALALWFVCAVLILRRRRS